MHDYVAALTTRLAHVRDMFASDVDVDDTVEQLSKWFSVLHEPLFANLSIEVKLLAAWSDPMQGIVAWSAKTGATLPPSFLSLFDGETQEASTSGSPDLTLDLTHYCVGRAAMRWAMAEPENTGGLALPYAVFGHASRGQLAWSGADDEVSSSSLTSGAEAEIRSEADKIRRNPGCVASAFDRDRTINGIFHAANPVSLEACASWTVRDLPIEANFLRVVAILAQSMPQFAAGITDMISNAAIVAALLKDESVVSFGVLLAVLRHLEPVFEDRKRTGSNSAWMVLLEVESRMMGSVHPGVSVDMADLTLLTRQKLADLFQVLDNRADGHRLAAEWLNHLIWARAFTPPGAAPQPPATMLRDKLLEVSAELFRVRVWNEPVRLWFILGGGPVIWDISESNPKGLKPERLPQWHDWLGNSSRIVPLAAAALTWNEELEHAALLTRWLRLVCTDLIGDTALRNMADSQPSILICLISRPLALMPNPDREFVALWDSLRDFRLASRFLATQDESENIGACKAVVRTGLAVLAWMRGCELARTKPLAVTLGDAVDEIRYCFPETGFDRWSDLAGALTTSMTVAGLLDETSLGLLLSRYDGDDDSLATAAAAALANGVPANYVLKGLTSLGEDPRALLARLKDWHEFNTSSKPSLSGQPPTALTILDELCNELGT